MGGRFSVLTLCALAAAGPAPAAAPTFSTFFGGGLKDFIRDVRVAPDGSIVVVGGTESTDFPTTVGAYDRSFNGTHDVIVVKFDAAGRLLWSTLFGGPNYDRAYAVELDAAGNIVVAGRAGDGFPTTAGVLQPLFGGDVLPSGEYGQQDGFVAKMRSDGTGFVWSTYFGGDDTAFIRDVDVDAGGNVYLVQPGNERAHPHVTPGAYQMQRGGAQDFVVAKLAPDASGVTWATYFGGSADDGLAPSIRVHSSGEVYVAAGTYSNDVPTTPGAYDRSYAAGGDLMVCKFSADGSALRYATYFGGSAYDFVETHNLWVDGAGSAYVAATTRSSDLPATAGAFQRQYGGHGGVGTGQNTNYSGDGFAAKFSPDGTALLAATYLGGSVGEGLEGSALDAAGNLWVAGATHSSDFPATAGAVQTRRAGGADFFVACLSGTLDELTWCTFLGGSGDDYGRTLALGSGGVVAVAGQTRSDDWPLAAAHQSCRHGDWDGAVALILPSSQPPRPAPHPNPVVVGSVAALPNPFAGSTVLVFELSADAAVDVEIYDASGRIVRSLLHESFSSGDHARTWDGIDDAGDAVPAGLYFAKLAAGGAVLTEKLVHLGR
jgi:hypothetical protein